MHFLLSLRSGVYQLCHTFENGWGKRTNCAKKPATLATSTPTNRNKIMHIINGALYKNLSWKSNIVIAAIINYIWFFFCVLFFSPFRSFLHRLYGNSSGGGSDECSTNSNRNMYIYYYKFIRFYYYLFSAAIKKSLLFFVALLLLLKADTRLLMCVRNVSNAFYFSRKMRAKRTKLQRIDNIILRTSSAKQFNNSKMKLWIEKKM